MYLKLSLLVVLLGQVTYSWPVFKRETKGFPGSFLSPISQLKQNYGPRSQAIEPSYAQQPSFSQMPSFPTQQKQSYGGAKKGYQQPARKLEPLRAAVVTKRTQEVIEVPIESSEGQEQVIIVEPHTSPITIEFRSRSSPVNINQVHIPGEKGQTKTTKSEEEPDRVIHEVVKPIIQEVREIIQPFRKITQQILPVQEEVHSIVSKGEKRELVEQVQQNEDSAVATPVQQPEPVQQQEVQQQEVQDLIASASTDTLVQAGLIGGTRIIPAGPRFVYRKK